MKRYFLIGIGILILSGCAVSHKKYCTEGGQPPREKEIPFKGTKRCYQKKNDDGDYVNDGKYFEWFPSEKIAITGEYKMGKKHGRWIEYNEKGKKLSDKYFADGKEVEKP